MSCKGHVFFESVNPEEVCGVLALLKQSNNFYSDTKIEINYMSSSFFYLNKNT